MSYDDERPITLSYGDDEDVVPIPEGDEEYIIPDDESLPSSSPKAALVPSSSADSVDSSAVAQEKERKAARARAYKPPTAGTLFGRLAKVCA